MNSELTSWAFLSTFNLTLNRIEVSFRAFNWLVILKWTIVANRAYNTFECTCHRIVAHLTWSHIRCGDTLMAAFPTSSTFYGDACTSRTEVSISKLDQLVSVWALIVLWAFITVSLVPKRVSTRCASLHHSLIFERTKETLWAVKTFDLTHLRESSIKTFKYSSTSWIWAHKAC